ncbi:MAG: TadE/TadG family type IV pilus assembly protein [Alphaproteobacteria bacterium]
MLASRLYKHKMSLRRNTDGVVAIEFAFIAPVVLLMIMGIIEFSLVMFTMAVMESATSHTSRLGKTGYTEAGSTREEQIIANIQALTTGLLDPNQIQITAKVYDAFDNVGDPEPFVDANSNMLYDEGETYSDINGNSEWDADMGSAGFGDANDVVVYTVSYPWRINTPIISNIIGNIFTITTRAAVKNEPYNIVNL